MRQKRGLQSFLLLFLLIVAGCAGQTGMSPLPSATPSASPTAPGVLPSPTPTPALPPVCPTLRPDPTFGISLLGIQTGAPLCERNPDGIAQPASTTKVMAALLIKEYLLAHHLGLDTQVRVESVDTQVEWDASIAHVQVGQSYSVRLLLYMVSIPSAADATMVLARFVAGSRAAFLSLMNTRAQVLGMTHTHFSSPYGYALTPPDHWQQGEEVNVGNYSSAHDLALLMRAFARYPDLVSIFGATNYQEGNIWLDRGPKHVITDSWIGVQAPDAPSPDAVRDLHLPFQVLAVKKGCMWCALIRSPMSCWCSSNSRRWLLLSCTRPRITLIPWWEICCPPCSGHSINALTQRTPSTALRPEAPACKSALKI